MLGDNQKQEQKQDVKQETVVHGQGPTIEVSCDHYTNIFIESMEVKLKQMLQPHAGFNPQLAIINSELKKARKVNVLHHQGHITKVFCSFLVTTQVPLNRSPWHEWLILEGGGKDAENIVPVFTGR